MSQESTRATTAPDPEEWRKEVEARQRATLKKMFANRARTPATADFDLPAPNDEIAPPPSTGGEPNLDLVISRLEQIRDASVLHDPVELAKQALVCAEALRAKVAGGEPATNSAGRAATLEEAAKLCESLVETHGLHSNFICAMALRELAAREPAPVARVLDVESALHKAISMPTIYEAAAFRKGYHAAITAAPAAPPEQPKWISVEDRLPDDDCHVLGATWLTMTNEQNVEVVSFRHGSRKFSEYPVTHWMRLPAAPKIDSPLGAKEQDK